MSIFSVQLALKCASVVDLSQNQWFRPFIFFRNRFLVPPGLCGEKLEFHSYMTVSLGIEYAHQCASVHLPFALSFSAHAAHVHDQLPMERRLFGPVRNDSA